MKYKSFRIQNFKGIKDTTIELQGVAGASVFAFVGLNESGKTTVLEAIHSFHPDNATSELIGGEDGLGVPFKDRVPRHLISNFTSNVTVTATLRVTPEDKALIASRLLTKHELVLNITEFPDEVVLERQQRFENGDFIESFFSLRTSVKVKGTKEKGWRVAKGEEKTIARNAIFLQAPSIAYFPTFVFDFPETIFLTERGGVIDKFYRRVFQDILDYDGRDQSIDKDILRRVHREEMLLSWVSFLAAWSQNDDRDKIQQVMDRAGAAVTKLVFGRWNRIFGEDTKGKEVVITWDLIEGEKEDARGAKSKTQRHDVTIKFSIRDGTRRFNVNDRSLGFRWFFSFMLFTQFRIARSTSTPAPLLFLFDEPASNLHAAAQQKLIESFPEIGKNEHVLAYSTHSHYMIEPKWLEQTFIVTNRADNMPVGSILEQISLDDESLDVKVSPYRSFVNSHPGQTTYFQPILDRLEVVPSRFDIRKASIVLEGKSDYYVLRYAQRLLNMNELPLLPGLGAGTFGALAALHVGWNLQFLFVLDGDKQGLLERNRYVGDFGIPLDCLVTINEIVAGVVVIEDLLDTTAREIVQRELKLAVFPNKAQIVRFFQERLANDNMTDLGPGFSRHAAQLLEGLWARLSHRDSGR